MAVPTNRSVEYDPTSNLTQNLTITSDKFARARRNQGDDLPLRSARWFLEKPRATGPGSLGGPKERPLTYDFAPLLSEPQDLFHHALAVLHDSAYNQVNADALRAEGPRIPLPGWPDGEGEGESVAEALIKSAARGRQLARLLDADAPVPGVTEPPLRPESTAIAVPSTKNGSNMGGEDFAVTARWGHYGKDDAVMPGQGRVVERNYTPDERATLNDTLPVLGENTFDVHLNENAFWRNVPATVWTYQLGGYQVLKKWLSYRKFDVLGRALLPEEVQHFTDISRRIGAILLSIVRWVLPVGTRGRREGVV